ncbi:MAG: DUF2070 family protein [Candidatus Caldarchaeum sp.]|nr:DUF2070 family protein [Candidatus Caldarchaeum sp.]
MVSTAAGSIAARYRLLKGFYGGVVSVEALASMALLFAAFLYVFTNDFLYGLAGFSTFLLVTVVINRLADFFLTKRVYSFTARRLDSLSVIEMMVVLFGAALSALISLFNVNAALALASALTTVAVFIGYSVRRAIGLGLAIPVAAILSTPAAIVNIFTINTYINNFIKSMQISFTAFIVGAGAMETIRYIVDTFKPVQVLKPFKLLQAFLTSLLSGQSKELENMMTVLSNSEDVKCELFLIKRDEKPTVAMVVSEIHPGPFRAVGSSMFPAIVQQKLGSRGIQSVVLKGLSSHEKNLASIELSEKIAEKIAEEAESLQKSSNYSRNFKPPTRRQFNGVSSLTFELAGRRITILTLHPQPMEDLPPEILPDGKHDKMVVVDAHNSFDDNLKHLESETIAKIRNYLENFETMDERMSELRVGFARVVPADFGLADGMGAGGVSCMVFECGGSRTSLLVADANNALPWVRSAAYESARKHGIDDTEFCTTDTHMVNAVSLGGRGYHPFGEAIPAQAINNLFDELHHKAVEDLAPAQAIHKTIIFKDTKVFSDFLDTVSNAVNFGVKTYGAGGAAAFAASLLLAVILS